MFKKLKDKLAEEVKSSPQRIQQFAQAAQAAVTSASSSISDITNSDLFSIGDNDAAQSRQVGPNLSPNTQQNKFQDVSLTQPHTDSLDFSHENVDGQKQRRLSNSSFASDVSFRLPSYETPSMYHLQSDMEVSASEADERGFSGGPATLDRVTKEQLYAAYKRTQDRYKKYRTQYSDLARHYKLLERENAKARSVLVETQDKALRRISELKEQCTLEQSAKAHLEKALRVEIEEKNMKIDTLNTKIQLLQGNTTSDVGDNVKDNSNKPINEKQNEVQLINLDNENNLKPIKDDSGSEMASMNVKIEKMEQLLNKYKESLKASKEKNSQITTELQILTNEIDNKNKQIKDLMATEAQLNEAKTKIQELNNLNEELQNQINTFDFTKTRELSTLELDLEKANEEIAELQGKIEVFTKREEEYAISLAENKLSIHKELESKETEIKSLKDSLSDSKQEIQSLKIVIDDYKINISALEEEKLKLNSDYLEFSTLKNKNSEVETKLLELNKKCQSLEQFKTKADEEYKCLQLQLKQETAEKLAMIDRNLYLESKNTQLSEDNTKKNSKITHLENELQSLSSDKGLKNALMLKDAENRQLLDELDTWKDKCGQLELEIQEERDELVKLQTEIEKLLSNHELIQTQNAEFRSTISQLTLQCSKQREDNIMYKSRVAATLQKTVNELAELRKNISQTCTETKVSLDTNKEALSSITKDVNIFLNKAANEFLKDFETITAKYDSLKLDYDKLQTEITTTNSNRSEFSNELNILQKENDYLKEKIKENESEINIFNEKLQEMSYKYDTTLGIIKLKESENESLSKTIKEKDDNAQKLKNIIESEEAKHLATSEKLKIYDTEKQTLLETIQGLQLKIETCNMEIEKLKDQHKTAIAMLTTNHGKILKMKEEEIEKALTEAQNNLKTEITQHSQTLEQLKLLDTEKNKLHEAMESLENVNKTLSLEMEKLSTDHTTTLQQLIELNNEIQSKSIALTKSQEEQLSLEKEIAQFKGAYDTVTELVKVKEDLNDELKSAENKIKLINAELKELKVKYKVAEDRIGELNTNLMNKSQECDDTKMQINKLEEDIRFLNQENISLKSESINFVSNIGKLESEINDIRQSHKEIETEKDRLNKIIEMLENKHIEQDSKDTQTDKDENVIIDDTASVFENKWLMENKQTDMSNTASLNLKKQNQDDVYEEYSSLKLNYDSLKDENRRLQSDIEGLQTYLTKISKENSILNDKLRELIATSEHSTDNQSSGDVKELITEIQISKEKINDLTRENSVLIEENLELKEQLQFQNYSKPVETKTAVNNDKDLNLMRTKYNELLQNNSQLEKQNIDLEQINKSVNGNVQQLQEKNERLKLSNEKLERRLDEALVSLRHLHSLQENTELEYLRNILYEYLTGSGTHSITLAKVLSAIVKFDDVQTQMVLQKEKERQGFLRQLGII